MRNALVAVLVFAAVADGALVAEQAFAQQSRQGKEKERPAPPPLPRCPDLALGTYAYVREVPGGEPLAEDEIAVQWIVHNAGGAPYVAPGAAALSLSLEYLTPAGRQQIAAAPLPAEQAEGAAMILGQGQSWRGYLRATLPPEARRRLLRLRLDYVGHDPRRPPNDCNMANNEVQLARP